MNLPNLPTDNLYKFMALSGLFLIIFSFTLVLLQANRSQDIHRELKRLSTIMELKNFQNERDKKLGENIVENLGQSRKLLEELKFILEQKPKYMAFFVIFMLIGVILSITGFQLWYSRVQRYQDILIKNQALS